MKKKKPTGQNSAKVLQSEKQCNLPFRHMTRKMAQSTTNDHESPTEMIILSDVTMAAGFKLGMTKLCPLLERLQLLCTEFKMSARAQAVFWLDALYEKRCRALSNECELVFKMNLYENTPYFTVVSTFTMV